MWTNCVFMGKTAVFFAVFVRNFRSVLTNTTK